MMATPKVPPSSRVVSLTAEPTPALAGGNTSAVTVHRYRPRARVLAAPAGATALERLRALTDASAAPQPGKTIEADPAAAAQRIIEVLRQWGYLEVGD